MVFQLRIMKRIEQTYIVEEDGVVIYDSSDDQEDFEEEVSDSISLADSTSAVCNDSDANDPNIVEGMYLGGIVKDKDGYRLKENEEIFTDEYMRNYDRYITEKAAKQKREQNIISVGVILGCIVVIAFFFWLFL